MAKHTPGKWKPMYDGAAFDDKTGDTVGIYRVMVEGDDKLVCESCYEADARLIAAAPEMYEWLGKFIKANAEGPATEWVTRMCECDKTARALLAKIEGE